MIIIIFFIIKTQPGRTDKKLCNTEVKTYHLGPQCHHPTVYEKKKPCGWMGRTAKKVKKKSISLPRMTPRDTGRAWKLVDGASLATQIATQKK